MGGGERIGGQGIGKRGNLKRTKKTRSRGTKNWWGQAQGKKERGQDRKSDWG